MELSRLCESTGILVPEEYKNLEIGGIATDSRRVKKGDLFICIKGLCVDGHDYVGDAMARGAAAVLAERGIEAEIPTLYTEDTRHESALLYNALYGYPTRKLKIVGVTGTNGKTSLTFMLKAIFESAMYRCGLIGTVSSYSAGRKLSIRSDDPLANMTTPDPSELYKILAEMVYDGVEYVFMEATSHALTLGKLDAIAFDTVAFTNLTPEHLDFHGDMESYFAAKAKLFTMCERAVVNVGDEYGRRLRDMAPCPIVTCSALGGPADFTATQLRDCGVEGSEYKLVSKNHHFTVRTPIPGAFTVINTLEAATVALTMGISPPAIMAALGTLSGIDGRMERVKLGTYTDFSVFIDYAHTPDALYNLLTTARNLRVGDERVVLVFGCGGDRDKTKRKKMGRIASTLADFIVVTSDNSRSEEPMEIIKEIVSGMEKDADYVIIPERRRAVEFAVREAHAEDIILLAGKGHEEYEIDKSGKHYFSEREIAAEAAGKYHIPTY